jgi:hypothetical protein
MSAAALQARVLQHVLAERAAQDRQLTGLAGSFFTRVADLNRTPWALAAGFDFAYPQTRGERGPEQEQHARYFATLDQLQRRDPAVLRLVTEVFQLLRPVSALQEEPLRSQVVAQQRKQEEQEATAATG